MAGEVSGTIRNLLKGKEVLGHQPGEKRRVSITNINPVVRNKQLIIKGLAQGTSLYEMTYIINGIEFSAQKLAQFPLTVRQQNSTLFCSQATLDSKVQVRCSCKDFYYTWWYWDSKNKSLAGPKMKPYVRKTTTYPERNQAQVPGMCKHLIELTARLKTDRIIK